MPLNKAAVLIGGIAFLFLAAWRTIGVAGLFGRKEAWPIKVEASRTSMGLMMYRQVFVLLSFGVLSLAFASELSTTPLGFGIVAVMALFLLLKTAEHIVVAELRPYRLEPTVAAIGGFAYLGVLLSGI